MPRACKLVVLKNYSVRTQQSHVTTQTLLRERHTCGREAFFGKFGLQVCHLMCEATSAPAKRMRVIKY